MSRIGRNPITLPAGVNAVVNNNEITVSGPLGTLKQKFDSVNVEVKDNIITLSRINDENEVKAKHGLYRALIANMVKGVKEGFTKNLQIKGVGYKASKSGNKLVLNLGFSHPIEVVEPEGIKIECPSATDIKISGIDKQKVGQVALNIRDLRPVEPYHGYGVRYENEVVILKQGKAAGKGKK
ncbi:MAG: 50S ribosomal protein L6 [Clostridia bacterium]|nr:50S ribosomal protein L6 [Clostridia bacterium]